MLPSSKQQEVQGKVLFAGETTDVFVVGNLFIYKCRGQDGITTTAHVL